MKVEELMIGDIICAIYEECDDEWNEITHNIPSRITGVSLYHDLGDCMRWECEPISDENKKLYDRFDSFEPIPLTTEILEKNGFEWKDGFWVLNHPKYHHNILMRYIDEDTLEPIPDLFINHWVLDESYIIDSVHELQRALRCWGLWDIANNFKV